MIAGDRQRAVQLKQYLFVILLTLLSLVAIQLVATAKASAAPVVDLIPDGSMPADIEAYLLDCGGTNNAAAQIGWLSLAGDPSSILTSLDYGTPSINLQYNVAGIVCRQSGMGGLVSTTNGVLSTNPNIPALNGAVLSYNYGGFTGAYSVAVQPFTYTHPGGFINSGEYVFELTEKRINVYSSGPRYRCVTNPGDVNPRSPVSSTDYGACRSIGNPFFGIWIDIRNRQPTGSIVADCNLTTLTVTISANDPDGGTPGVQIAVAPSLGNITATGTYTYNGRPRDGVSYTVSGYITDAQTGQRIDLASDTYVCPLPPPAPVCGASSPTSIEAGSPFTLSLGISNPAPTQTTSYTLRTSSINGVTYSSPLTVTAGTSASASFSFPAGLPANTYNYTWTYTNGVYGPGGTLGPPPCSGSLVVSNRPIAKFFGGDLQAGGAFATGGACVSPGAGSRNALGFIRSAGGNDYIGTSAQLGIFALNQINGIRTTGQRSPSVAPSSLSFSNVAGGGVTVNSAPSTGPFGGGFATALPCARDYYADRTGGGVIPSSDLSTVPSGKYLTGGGPGTTTIFSTGATGIPNGRQIVIYVNGNVHITTGGSTVFGYQNTSWNTVSDIPSLYIIASGNIFINNAMTRIDGNLIAQPNAQPNTGEIFTCSAGTDVLRPINGAFIAGSCNTQLVVNGTFIANKVHLLRTRGSLTAGGASLTTAETAINPASWTNNAEIFRYSPELYLRTNQFLTPTTSSGITYDAITSLAPAL